MCIHTTRPPAALNTHTKPTCVARCCQRGAAAPEPLAQSHNGPAGLLVKVVGKLEGPPLDVVAHLLPVWRGDHPLVQAAREGDLPEHEGDVVLQPEVSVSSCVSGETKGKGDTRERSSDAGGLSVLVRVLVVGAIWCAAAATGC